MTRLSHENKLCTTHQSALALRAAARTCGMTAEAEAAEQTQKTVAGTKAGEQAATPTATAAKQDAGKTESARKAAEEEVNALGCS